MLNNKPAWADLRSQFDFDAIREAIFKPNRPKQPTPQYAPDDVANIMEMIESAGQKWVPRDWVELNVTEVENLVEGTWPVAVKGYVDIQGTLNGTMAPFREFTGGLMIVDWKTRDGELSQDWKDRLVDSWQWRIYAYLTSATVINYRGVTRKCEAFSGCDTRDVLIGVPVSNTQEVVEYLHGLNEQRNQLIKIGAEVWPRHMPDACNKYRRECEYKLDCDTYVNIPRYVPEAGKVMSYTEFDRFARCPEYSRRKLRETGEEDDEALYIGSGFHRGIANLYEQLRRLKGRAA